MPFIEASPERATPVEGCCNCGATLAGPYCTQCGQKDRALNPSVASLIGDALADGLDVDGRLLRSVRLLFIRPGFLTTEFLAGRRASYVSPLRLYLVFSVIAFAAAAFTADRALLRAQGDVINLGLGQRLFLSEADGPEERQELVDKARELLMLRTAWLPRVMFVAMPIAALVLMGVTRRARLRYPQHLYFMLHVQAVVFAGSALLALLPRAPSRPVGRGWTTSVDSSPASLVGFVITLAILAYAVMATRRVYGGSWFVSIGRVAVVGIVNVAVVVAALLAMLGIVISGW